MKRVIVLAALLALVFVTRVDATSTCCDCATSPPSCFMDAGGGCGVCSAITDGVCASFGAGSFACIAPTPTLTPTPTAAPPTATPTPTKTARCCEFRQSGVAVGCAASVATDCSPGVWVANGVCLQSTPLVGGFCATATATPTAITPCNVTWTAPVNVTVTGNSLEKTSGADGTFDAGAVSTQTITTTGLVEAEVLAGDGNKGRAFGLSHTNSGHELADVEFAILLAITDGTYPPPVWISEGATGQPIGGPPAAARWGSYGPGDKVRVAVDAGVVTYSILRSGESEWRTLWVSTKTPTLPLHVIGVLRESNAHLSNVKIGGAGVCP